MCTTLPVSTNDTLSPCPPTDVRKTFLRRAISRAKTPFVAFQRWRESVLPEYMPGKIRDLFWMGVAAALGAAIYLVVACCEIIVGDSDATIAGLIRNNMFTVLFGFSGLVVAYGIKKEHVYPRLLACLFVLAFACHHFWLNLQRNFLSSEDLVLFFGAFATFKYLLLSDEADPYYARLGIGVRTPAEASGNDSAGVRKAV